MDNRYFTSIKYFLQVFYSLLKNNHNLVSHMNINTTLVIINIGNCITFSKKKLSPPYYRNLPRNQKGVCTSTRYQ